MTVNLTCRLNCLCDVVLAVILLSLRNSLFSYSDGSNRKETKAGQAWRSSRQVLHLLFYQYTAAHHLFSLSYVIWRMLYSFVKLWNLYSFVKYFVVFLNIFAVYVFVLPVFR